MFFGIAFCEKAIKAMYSKLKALNIFLTKSKMSKPNAMDTNHILVLICICLLLVISYILYMQKECPTCVCEKRTNKK